MASSLLSATDIMNAPVHRKRCAVDSFGAREPEEKLFRGCAQRGSCASLDSCSDVASLDSENESSLLWQRTSSTLKCDEDACCASLLECEDTLDLEDEDATREWAPGTQLIATTSYFHEDAERTLGMELAKEQELGPFTITPLPIEYRGVLVQWMRDVCAARSLSQATFFSSVALLDRFIRLTGEGATPPTLLQLVALTCISIAAKNEQQCAAELLSVASDQNGCIYRAEDFRMMELHLFGVLDYRLRVPTLYTFVCLFLHRLSNRPQDGQVVPPGAEARFRSLVLRLAELASLDHELTAVPYSTLAVACLLIAETEVKGGQAAGGGPADLRTVDALRAVPGFPDMTGLSGPVQRLYVTYKSTLGA